MVTRRCFPSGRKTSGRAMCQDGKAARVAAEVETFAEGCYILTHTHSRRRRHTAHSRSQTFGYTPGPHAHTTPVALRYQDPSNRRKNCNSDWMFPILPPWLHQLAQIRVLLLRQCRVEHDALPVLMSKNKLQCAFKETAQLLVDGLCRLKQL